MQMKGIYDTIGYRKRGKQVWFWELLTVKSRRITDPFIEEVWLFLIPVFHGLKWWDVAQSHLGDVLVIDLDVAFNGSGQMLG